MLFLLMQLDGDRYALDARDVAELLPLIDCKPILGAPACVAGVIDYGGEPVPVIDLSELLARRPARRRLSTRIVLVDANVGAADRRRLGLIAEHATETVRRDPADFRATGVAVPNPPQLGGVAFDAAGPVHLLDLRTLLPEPVRQALASSPATLA